MTLRHPLVGVIGLVAFSMNPGFACSSGSSDDAPQFQYGETEMTAAVQGRWQLTFSRPDGTSSVTFDVEPGPKTSAPVAIPPGRAPQCGTRTFVRPAAACIDTSQLYIAAHVVESDPPLATADGNGDFSVFGVSYGGGAMRLKFGSELMLSATLDPYNNVQGSAVDWQSARSDTSVLTRVAMR